MYCLSWNIIIQYKVYYITGPKGNGKEIKNKERKFRIQKIKAVVHSGYMIVAQYKSQFLPLRHDFK